MTKLNYICPHCGSRSETSTLAFRCACGGLWKLDYQAPKFDLERIERDTWSLFRYRAFLPLEGDAWRAVSLGEGMTPVVQLDEDVLVKMDYLMPTLSFKDRGAALLIAHCKAIGVKAVVQDSSGNAGNSIAAYCARAGIACDIYVPQSASPQKIAMIHSHGARLHVIPGRREDCARACRQRAEQEGLFYASHVYNPLFFEGTKTYLYEVYEQLGRVPQNLFIPLGNGSLFLGVVKALEELLESGLLSTMPNVVAVQSERCDPIARAADAGLKRPIEMAPGATLAEGIAIGAPARGEEILQLIQRYHFQVVRAPEERILEARSALARRGIYVEHTTAATYAAYIETCERRGTMPDSLLPLCGAGLKSDH